MPLFHVFTLQRTYREYLLDSPSEDGLNDLLKGKPEPTEVFHTDEMITETRLGNSIIKITKEPATSPESPHSKPEAPDPKPSS